MKTRHLIGQGARIGLLVAALVLIAGIIAAPLLQWLWPSSVTIAEMEATSEDALRPTMTAVE